jgi:hypothetical protein
MMWKMLEVQGLLNGITSNEINFVFDNCAGQNKNRMVYRLLFFLVKLGICRKARAIFLVKGHTKNDCDRMFNLMKYDYRKVNCFTPPELLELVNKHPQVRAIAMEEAEFKNWDDLENKMISKMGSGVSRNHIFSVSARDSNAMIVQEHAGAQTNRQLLVRKEFRDIDWRPLFKLQQLVPPGLPDIKWNELYAKWGKFVPEERKKGLKYFTEKPPDSVKKAIAEQTAAAREARAKRSRSAAIVNDSVVPAKKRGRPKKQNPNP